MQWLQDQNQSNVYSLKTVICEASRHFRNKMKVYLKAKIEEIETNSNIKTIRDLTLINFHLDVQNSYLFIYNTFIKILYMF
jgi:hypothetical protein